MNFNDVAIVYVEENAYRIHFCYMNKDEQQNGRFVIFFIIYKKWVMQLIIKKTET